MFTDGMSGMPRARIGVALLLLAAAMFAVTGRVGARASGAVLLYDNFSGPGVNPLVWIENVGAETNSSQLSTPQGDVVDSNGLHIVANRTPGATLYTSGMLTSVQSFLYGHLDIVARFPTGTGLVPQLWTRNYDNNGQMNGEIDLVEGFGSHPTRFQTTLHHWHHGYEPRPDCAIIDWLSQTTICQHPRVLPERNYSVGYHDFGVNWQPHRITFLLDGKPYFTTTNAIPDQPMQLIMNLAVAGFWDGYPDATTHFPASLDIRSVKWTSA